MIPTLAGSPALTAGTNNPILDEIDRAHATLSPGAQAALAKAKLGMTPGVLPGPLPEMGGGTLTTPPPSPIAAPRTIPSLGAPKAPLVPPMTPVQTGHQNELARLTAPPPSDPSLIHSHQNTGASGIDQIKHAGIRVPLQILQAIGGGFFPNVAALTPGTQMRHQLLVRQAQGNVASDELQRKTEAEVGHLGAQSDELESRPELRQAQNDIKGLHEQELVTSHRNAEDINRAKAEGTQAVKEAQISAQLAQHGMKKDPETGEIVSQSYEEMSEPLQAVHDLKAAQAEQAEATKALREAQAKNLPQAASLAQARLQSAQQAHSIAMRRLNLSETQTEARLFGTNKGKPLPGSILTDENKPVGSMFQANVRPTGTERTRADLAHSAQEQLDTMRAIVKRHPEFFGPGAGRKTEFTKWIGSQDPEVQRFSTARDTLANHASGVFGARSEYASKAAEIASGQFKDNPDAILAGLEQIEKAMGTIRKKGDVRTTGSDVAKEAPGAMMRARDPQGKLHEAPAGTPLPAGWKKE